MDRWTRLEGGVAVSQEASIDDLSTALNKFCDGLPSYFEDKIQRRIDALSKVYNRSEYEITAEDEEKCPKQAQHQTSGINRVCYIPASFVLTC
jgi:hypothetical protein